MILLYEPQLNAQPSFNITTGFITKNINYLPYLTFFRERKREREREREKKRERCQLTHQSHQSLYRAKNENKTNNR